MDIDAVYTWVDGSDPEHIRLRREFFTPTYSKYKGNSAKRWGNHDELRYSLRSLLMFAPWVRLVHIVTNGQVPPWLDLSNPRVRLVTHEQIYRWPEHLPTFNSVSIESHLHRIPGLSEMFVYFNDDTFLGRECPVGEFFTPDGKMVFAHGGKLHYAYNSRRDVWRAGTANARRLLTQEYGKRNYTMATHHAKPFRKSFLDWVDARWMGVVRENSAARFRSPNAVAMCSAFLGNCAVAEGCAIAKRRGTYSITASRSRRGARLRLESIIKTRPAFFCINDNGITRKVGSILAAYLRKYFPNPSEFELQ